MLERMGSVVLVCVNAQRPPHTVDRGGWRRPHAFLSVNCDNGDPDNSLAIAVGHAASFGGDRAVA